MHRQSKNLLSRTTRISGSALNLILAASTISCSGPLGVTDDFEEGFFQSGDIRLHYVIDFPPGSGPFPAVVFGHGSGRKTIQSYERFARRMVGNGVAMVRYDKRGVGKSGGVHVASNSGHVNEFLPLLADDMAAAATFLAQHPKIDITRLGLMGESQAGWVIPTAAVLEPEVDFVLVLSGPTLPLSQVSVYESLANESPDGDLDAFADEAADVGRGGYDPRPWLRDLEVPGLWLYGARDVNVPVKTCVELLQNLVDALEKDFTYIVYPNGDHGLRDYDTGDPINYVVDLLEWFDVVVGR